MNPIATKRPGVYSQYAVTSLYVRPVSERAAALAGVFPEVEGVTRLSRLGAGGRGGLHPLR